MQISIRENNVIFRGAFSHPREVVQLAYDVVQVQALGSHSIANASLLLSGRSGIRAFGAGRDS